MGILFLICVNCARIGKKYVWPLDEFTWQMDPLDGLQELANRALAAFHVDLAAASITSWRKDLRAAEMNAARSDFNAFLLAQSTSK